MITENKLAEDLIINKMKTLTEGTYDAVKELPCDQFGTIISMLITMWCSRNEVDTLEILKALDIVLTEEHDNAIVCDLEEQGDNIIPESEATYEIRNSNGSLLFRATYKDKNWIIEVKKKEIITRLALYDDGDMNIINYNINDRALADALS